MSKIFEKNAWQNGCSKQITARRFCRPENRSWILAIDYIWQILTEQLFLESCPGTGQVLHLDIDLTQSSTQLRCHHHSLFISEVAKIKFIKMCNKTSRLIHLCFLSFSAADRTRVTSAIEHDEFALDIVAEFFGATDGPLLAVVVEVDVVVEGGQWPLCPLDVAAAFLALLYELDVVWRGEESLIGWLVVVGDVSVFGCSAATRDERLEETGDCTGLDWTYLRMAGWLEVVTSIWLVLITSVTTISQLVSESAIYRPCSFMLPVCLPSMFS